MLFLKFICSGNYTKINFIFINISEPRCDNYLNSITNSNIVFNKTTLSLKAGV